jgi:RHS repeat-associated protein
LATANHNSGNSSDPILDRLAYHYVPGTNRLDYVTDDAETNSFDGDIDKGEEVSNYQYDADGNLVHDVQQGVHTYWNVQGKVDRVETARGFTRFSYDAGGNRVFKQQVNATGLSFSNYYIRDAQGAVLAVYEKTEELGKPGDILMSEVPLYGSEKLGSYVRPVSLGASGGVGTPTELGELRILENVTKDRYESLSYLVNPGIELTIGPGFAYTSTGEGMTFGIRVGAGGEDAAIESDIYTRKLSSRKYELTDHLGNIRTLVTDIKLSTITATVADNFTPEVVSVQNYYPFGMEIPGRSWSAGAKYRYGFNGKENDQSESEMRLSDFGARIYNRGLGRFLSVDPLSGSFPEASGYQFAGNNPVRYIDHQGLFKLDPYFVERYPTLAKMVAYYLPLLKYNPQVKKAWTEATGRTEAEFVEMVTYGKGPYITVTRDWSELTDKTNVVLSNFFENESYMLDGGEMVDGYPNNLRIDKDEVGEMERIVSMGVDDASALQIAMVSFVIMHEAAHWGNDDITKGNTDYIHETGAVFEDKTFGTRFSYTRPRLADYSKQGFRRDLFMEYFIKNRHSPVFYGLTITPDYVRYWQRIKETPAPDGQTGDPTFIENGDYAGAH